MDEHSAGALQYGHLGTATYQPDSQSWTFSRDLAKSPTISYSGITKTSLPSSLRAPETSLQDDRSKVPKLHPELAASWSFIREERLSHAVSTATEFCDPRVSSLFDLGNAPDVDNEALRMFPIAAIVAGECSDQISFHMIEEDTLQLKHEKSVWMRVPSIGRSETTEWTGCGAPVRQICFARTVEAKPTWMAARFPQSTIFFRPLYHRDPVANHGDFDGNHDLLPIHGRNSRLDANPLIEISATQTGGFAHADVAFNPWYQRQIAIVDDAGNWSIWEISGRQRREYKGNWTADRVRIGTLPWLDHGINPGLRDYPRHDGWASVEWAGDFSSFIVADRRCVMFYRMDGDRVSSYSIELGFERRSEWVLDIKRSSYNESHVFILTTSRIFWFDVGPDVFSAGSSDDNFLLHPRLSWRHYRDSEDTTLRFSLLLAGERFYLILYSRLNHLAQAFQWPVSRLDTFFVPDPFLLEVPSMHDDPSNYDASQHNAQFSNLVFKEIAHSLVGRRLFDQPLRPIKLFMLDTQHTLSESLYFGPGDNAYEGEEEGPLGRDVLQLKKRFAVGNANRKPQLYDDFVVDDWNESVFGDDSLTAPTVWMPTLATPAWTIDHTSVYQAAAGEPAIFPKSAKVERQLRRDFGELLGELENKVSSTDSSTLPTGRTLFELLESLPLLSDVDQNARDLERLSSINEHPDSVSPNRHPLVILPSRLPSISTVDPVSWLAESSKLDLISTYDHLVNDWLSNLPHDIPARTRITKERLIRGLTAELILSRVSFIPRALGAPDKTSKPGYNSGSGLPALTEKSDNVSTELATGLPLFAPSNIGKHRASAPTAPEIGASGPKKPSVQTEPICSTLSMLTTFNKKKAPSSNTSTILSHWQPGTNPDNYDWQKTAQIREIEDSRQATRTAAPRHRSRKSASQSIGLDSSIRQPKSPIVPSGREWGSQPQNEPPRVLLPSSQPVEDDLPMTQVERGIFGGREAGQKGAVKGRKKKRAAGF